MTSPAIVSVAAAAYTRQHMLDRFEFLALKREAKGLTQKEYPEMQWLRQRLLSEH